MILGHIGMAGLGPLEQILGSLALISRGMAEAAGIRHGVIYIRVYAGPDDLKGMGMDITCQFAIRIDIVHSGFGHLWQMALGTLAKAIGCRCVGNGHEGLCRHVLLNHTCHLCSIIVYIVLAKSPEWAPVGVA
jgi:hypothetical protein